MATMVFPKIVVARFSECLAAYDKHCPFTRTGQLQYHVETIAHRRALGSATAALADTTFLSSIYRTMKAWGIGSRRSVLKPFPEFVDALRAKAAEIETLEGIAIDDADLDAPGVGDRVADLVQGLDIVNNLARIVPGSKALHHILPDLVVPFDRAYTQRFFGWQGPRIQANPEACYAEAFRVFVSISRVCNPQKYVTGKGWYTSRTKVLDNAVVGMWCWARRDLAPRYDPANR